MLSRESAAVPGPEERHELSVRIAVLESKVTLKESCIPQRERVQLHGLSLEKKVT